MIPGATALNLMTRCILSVWATSSGSCAHFGREPWTAWLPRSRSAWQRLRARECRTNCIAGPARCGYLIYHGHSSRIPRNNEHLSLGVAGYRCRRSDAPPGAKVDSGAKRLASRVCYPPGNGAALQPSACWACYARSPILGGPSASFSGAPFRLHRDSRRSPIREPGHACTVGSKDVQVGRNLLLSILGNPLVQHGYVRGGVACSVL
jgi:hypothetical protein